MIFLLGSLNDWSENGRFTGIILDSIFSDVENFEKKIARAI